MKYASIDLSPKVPSEDNKQTQIKINEFVDEFTSNGYDKEDLTADMFCKWINNTKD